MTQANQDYYQCVLAIPAGYVDVPAHDINHTGLGTAYFQDFSGGTVDGWTAGASTTVGYFSPLARLSVGRASGTTNVVATRAITGLTVGLPYTITARVSDSVGGGSSVTVGVSGVGTGAASPWNTSGMTPIYSFTATATSHTVVLTGTYGSSGGYTSYWDDITVTQPAWVEHVPDHTAYTASLNVVDGSLKITSTETPRISGSVTVGFPGNLAVLNAMNPSLKPRLSLTLERWDVTGNFTSLPVDVLLTDRTLNHNEGTIELTFASDEAQLQTYSVLTQDTTALGRQTSVRSIVNGVLAKVGASLSAGTIDQPFKVLASATNLILNPSAEVNAAEWAGSGVTITRVTTQAFKGTACIQASSTGNFGFFASNVSTYINATPATSYTFSVYARFGAAAGRTAKVSLRFLDGSNVQLLETAATPVTMTANTWTRLTVTATAPAGTQRIAPIMWATGVTSGEATFWDAAMLLVGNGKDTDGVTDIPYFDGSTTDGVAGTADYSYDWTGTAHASTSTRTPLINRTTDVLKWNPGDSAWDFLEPILSTCGYYLWVDGSRNWYLTDDTYTVSGLYSISVGNNLYTAKDTMSLTAKGLDGQPIVPDGVLCTYTWLDSNGVSQTATDKAGVEGAVANYEFNRPYPGPGTAQNILDKSRGRGRVLDITARPDLTPRPYQTVSITPPFADAQVGVITAIEWNFGQDEMTITTAGLVSTPSTAWLFAPGSRKWNTATGTWTTYTN